MAKTVTVNNVRRAGGKLFVRYAGKHGNVFSATSAAATFANLDSTLNDECVFLLALRQIGLANAETLEGKTISISFDVTIT